MKPPIKKGWIIAIGVILLLWILNPSINQFKGYIGTYPSKYDFVVFTKTGNYIIFSTFHVSSVHKDVADDTYSVSEETESATNMSKIEGDYYGAFLNFFKKNTIVIQHSLHQESMDSTKISKTETILSTSDSNTQKKDPLDKIVYKTKDGQIVTQEQLLYSGYSMDRIKRGIMKGILTPY